MPCTMGLVQELSQGCVLARLWGQGHVCPGLEKSQTLYVMATPPGRALPLTLKYCRAARCKKLFAAISSPERRMCPMGHGLCTLSCSQPRTPG